MSGIGLILNVAKDALLTQQYAMDVVSHNITNVSTDGYSKQVPVLSAKTATPYGGFLFGRGVELNEIVRNANDLIEKRLQNGQSDLLAMTEQELYMGIMESIFNENSSRSLSNQFNDFWNAWNDLSNNPSGQAERNILVESGSLLAQSFQEISDDLTNLDREIDNSIDAGTEAINQILTQIADLNGQILFIETTGNANDLRDQRNMLVNELSEYINVNTYEHDDGNLTVTTGRGYILVSRGDTYPLDFINDEVIWQSSQTAQITITDTIEGGKMGGWLDIRDEILPKYYADLDEIAKSVIWETNKVHSQGVGLNAFSSVSGTYKASDISQAMGTTNSGLDYYDKITDGSFKLWLYDENGNRVSTTSIPILSGTTTLDTLATTISAIHANIDATISDGKLLINTSNNYTFGFSDDTSNILAALGLNTFFTGAAAREIDVNNSVILDKNNVAAAKINNNVGPAVADSGNSGSTTGVITTSGPYTGTNDATYYIEITTTGDEGGAGGAVIEWNKDGGTPTSVNLAGGSTVTLSDGVEITFTPGNYQLGDIFTVDVTASSDTYGDFAPGDNTNSLDVADLQYQETTIKRWTYTRGSSPTSQDVSNTTIDDYLHLFVGSIGIESQSITREREYKETIQDEMNATRDNISAVSLDEEMADLIKYQQAYTAAAKLITTSEEMLETILNTV
jgi:flagellar hook-associated protein 1